MNQLRIDIGVGGRFHADYMTSALLAAGHDVALFTTFPASRFPKIPRDRVTSLLFPELVFRALKKVGLENPGDLFKMAAFGNAFARAAKRRPRDLVIAWSSFGLETLRASHATTKAIVRDSAHIAFQNEVLEAEYRRLGLRYPNREACAARELEEYRLADRILVPSSFAKKTFLDRGFSGEKVQILRLGANLSLFRPEARIAPTLPLRVVYFGTLSVQKGVHHLLEATKEFSPEILSLELIGSLSPEFAPILKGYSHAAHFPAMDHPRLAERVRGKDIFVFPTLHDGFGQTLVQAMASGVLPVTTDHCGAAELVKDGESGLVLPAGDAPALRRALLDLSEDLPRVKRMREAASRAGSDLSWENYDRALGAWVQGLFPERKASHG